MAALLRHILVTGAAGFVGRHLTASLTAQYPDAVLHMAPFDVADADLVASTVRRSTPDVCIHLAAISAVRAAEQNEDRAWQVNLHGTLNIAHAILRHAPECQMVFASSAEAYGSSFRAGKPVGEDVPLAPMSLYGATKAGADLALGSLAARGLNCVRLRPFNHIGPGQSEHFVVAAFARQVARIEAGLQPPLLEVGNISSRRDFLDVRDVCAAYVACVDRRDALPRGIIINLASGHPRQIGEVLSDLRALANIALEVRVDPARLRGSDVPETCGDASSAHRLLDWKPVVPWTRTLQDVLDDWRERIKAEPKGS